MLLCIPQNKDMKKYNYETGLKQSPIVRERLKKRG